MGIEPAPGCSVSLLKGEALGCPVRLPAEPSPAVRIATIAAAGIRGRINHLHDMIVS